MSIIIDDVNMEPADSEPMQVDHSDSDFSLIIELTMWHRMPYFSARRLTQLNSKRWPVWNCPYTMKRIEEVRREDDTRDWYFPIIVKKLGQPGTIFGETTPPDYAWPAWSGIWHSNAGYVLQDRVHTLPPMTHVLPHEWTRRYQILAVSAGLVLIMTGQGAVPLRRSRRLNPRLILARAANHTSASTSSTRRRQRSSWQRLLVCNPLSKECRELPAPGECKDVLGWSTWQAVYFHGVQAHMLVDDQANSYQVTLTSRHIVCVYTSTSNTWACLRFPVPRPWGRPRNEKGINTWGYHSASAHVGGRLYFADVESQPGANAGMDPIQVATAAGALRLFEMEGEAGRWNLVHTYTLRKSHLPFLNRRSSWPCDMGVIQFMELVECRGNLYAVIPARLNELLTVGPVESSCRWRFEVLDRIEMGTELEYMPLVFHIVQLQGDGGVDHGVLRMQIPRTRRDIRSRRERLYEKTCQFRQRCRNFFSCHARGGVIWVSCDDYVLQYDVESRESKTQLIPLESTDETLAFAYRPSFHMKP